MRRAYNHNLSKEINEQLDRRAQIVRRERRFIALAAIIVIAFGILLGTSIKAFASSQNPAEYHKYYTSVRVESGDTLWTIADQYMTGCDMDKQSYIDEVCRLNGLTDGRIHSGDYIVVAYYSTELQ